MKLKTHKTTAKRVRVTGSGALQRPTLDNQHLRHNKSRRIKAASKGYATLDKANTRKFKKLLPYL